MQLLDKNQISRCAQNDKRLLSCRNICVTPYINGASGADGWRTSLLILSVLVLAVAFASLAILRNRPEEKGLSAAGSEDPPLSSGKPIVYRTDLDIYRESIWYHLGAIYFLFGATYVIYTTFLVTSLAQERGFPEARAGNLWAVLGFFSLFSGPVFGTLSDRMGRKTGLMIVFSLQAVSYLLAASGAAGPPLVLSVVLFGVAAWSIPSIMAAAAGDYAGHQRAAQAFGLLTFIFGIGQMAGPLVAGFIAGRTGGFSASFRAAAIMARLAITISAFLSPSGRRAPS